METYIAIISTGMSIAMCLRILWLERKLEDASKIIFSMATGEAEVTMEDGLITIKYRGV
jgi:hypothetical protein